MRATTNARVSRKAKLYEPYASFGVDREANVRVILESIFKAR